MICWVPDRNLVVAMTSGLRRTQRTGGCWSGIIYCRLLRKSEWEMGHMIIREEYTCSLELV